MPEEWKAGELLDRDVLDRHGTRIGSIERVYLDARSGAPSFVAIHTGLLSRSPSVVPLTGATTRDGALVLPLDKARVKGAPPVEPAGQNGGLSPGQERALRTFYAVTPEVAPTPAPAPPPAPAPEPDRERAPDDAMTRSEEQLRVHTENHPTGRARLRKYVVTEDVQVTVPVSREEFRVEWEPIDPDETPAPTDDDPADDDGLTLHAERVVVRTETVPTERVRLTKEQVTEDRTVTDQVRREKIDLDRPEQ
ncbi:YsnF/AvaK domain-containing protein [Cryptosporangium aurantiacum]|uniref:Conserved domain-containing protein n=1 Tax=Cryptosporangium aurantiacum TaxID=134849 RepID=A0A1M7PSH4_9ACTN|nr:YsnF/AvaK domain-containing protein [Cryptosporangium aurantiacum]SHN20387.1 conserved domain-containing protein [Cryptosporangium aurantiacum]